MNVVVACFWKNGNTSNTVLDPCVMNGHKNTIHAQTRKEGGKIMNMKEANRKKTQISKDTTIQILYCSTVLQIEWKTILWCKKLTTEDLNMRNLAYKLQQVFTNAASGTTNNVSSTFPPCVPRERTILKLLGNIHLLCSSILCMFPTVPCVITDFTHSSWQQSTTQIHTAWQIFSAQQG